MKEFQSVLGKLEEMLNFNSSEKASSLVELSSMPSSFVMFVEVVLLFYLEKFS